MTADKREEINLKDRQAYLLIDKGHRLMKILLEN
jgi:hypothetical protein